MQYKHQYFRSIPFSFPKKFKTSNTSLEPNDNNLFIDIKKLCLKNDIAYRYTGHNPVGYYENRTTFDHVTVFKNNKNKDFCFEYNIAGTKQLQGLKQPYYDLKLLEIFAFCFNDYVVRECVCILDLFKENKWAREELDNSFMLVDNPLYSEKLK